MAAKTLELSLSQAIFGPTTSAFKAGGYGLAFLSLGAFLMLAAFLHDRGALSYWLFGAGFCLIALTCVLFLFKDVIPLLNAHREIKSSAETVDTVQMTAIELTEITSELQALAFKHASAVTGWINGLRGSLRLVPGIGNMLADNDLLRQADNLSANIVTLSTSTKAIIGDVEKALRTSDAALLKTYLGQLRTCREELIRALSA